MTTPTNLDGLFVDETLYFPDDEVQFKLKFNDNNRDHAVAINNREISLYLNQEIYTGGILFDNRPIFRMVVDCGALPNTGTSLTPHGITLTPNFAFLKIQGSAFDPTALEGIPLPFADSTPANCISVTVTTTDIEITTGSNRSNFTTSFILLEYIKG